MPCVKFDKILSIILSICCYGGSIYMVAVLFSKYDENLDASRASMKQFNGAPQGRYPSFTFCMYAKNGHLFKEKILYEKVGLSQMAYYQLLTGEQNRTTLKLPKIEFNDTITGIDEFLEEFEVEDYSYFKYNQWTVAMNNTTESPFHPSYQDPTTNCFTYDTKYSRSVSLSTLHVQFNITTLKRLLRKAKLYILVHYPGLLIRNMKTYLMKVKDWKELNPRNRNNYIRIAISGVTLMRFRETANETCDPNLIDDDAKWKLHVAKEIGCTPPYWNNNGTGLEEDEHICNSKAALGGMKAYWPMYGSILDTNKIFEKYPRPCNNFQQLIFNTVERQYNTKPKHLKIKIRLQNEMYQEILNTRAFGRTDLWGSIGGYVGMFCGYSILHAISHLIENFTKCLESSLKIWTNN